MKLASGIAPVPDFLAAGIAVALGTDGCASNNDLDLFGAMDFTAKLHKVHRADPTAADAAAVLHAATRGGAVALGLAEQTGSIEVGKKADLIVLDGTAPHLVPLYNPVSQLVYAARGADVRWVIVDGRLLMDDRRLLTIDVDDAMDRVRRLARRIANRS
jgi:5-methylthioadenosine/S-adenosylhomocysteine deaminase